MIAYSSWILVWLIQSDWMTESIHLSCTSKSLFVLVQTTDTPQNTYCAEAWIIALLCPAQALILVAWSLSIFEIAPWTSCVHADLSGPWICWSHWANAQSPARTLKVRFCTKDVFMNLLQCKIHHWLALHLKHGYLFCHGTSFTHLKHQDHKWKKETHEAVRQSWILWVNDQQYFWKSLKRAQKLNMTCLWICIEKGKAFGLVWRLSSWRRPCWSWCWGHAAA